MCVFRVCGEQVLLVGGVYGFGLSSRSRLHALHSPLSTRLLTSPHAEARALPSSSRGPTRGTLRSLDLHLWKWIWVNSLHNHAGSAPIAISGQTRCETVPYPPCMRNAVVDLWCRLRGGFLSRAFDRRTHVDFVFITTRGSLAQRGLFFCFFSFPYRAVRLPRRNRPPRALLRKRF